MGMHKSPSGLEDDGTATKWIFRDMVKGSPTHLNLLEHNDIIGDDPASLLARDRPKSLLLRRWVFLAESVLLCASCIIAYSGNIIVQNAYAL